jgi:hypothetical protein
MIISMYIYIHTTNLLSMRNYAAVEWCRTSFFLPPL